MSVESFFWRVRISHLSVLRVFDVLIFHFCLSIETAVDGISVFVRVFIVFVRLLPPPPPGPVVFVVMVLVVGFDKAKREK